VTKDHVVMEEFEELHQVLNIIYQEWDLLLI
jgi:hypothetical protein